MLGRYDRALRARGPVGRLTLLQQAIAAIRRNNGALFYVPQNFAGSWTDSAGTDPVDAVADVIGLMTDRSYGANNLGPELAINNSFDDGSAWNRDAGWSISGGNATCTAPGSAVTISQPAALEAGAFYICEYTVEQISAGALFVRFGGGTVVNSTSTTTTGKKTVFVQAATGNDSIGIRAQSTTVGAVISSVSFRKVLGAVATQATTANKPTVQRPATSNVIRFDSSNDSLSVNLASGGSPFVRSYTGTGTVSGATSATTSAFVIGQPTVAGRDVCAIVCAPNAITGADLTAIERWAVSIGATL